MAMSVREFLCLSLCVSLKYCKWAFCMWIPCLCSHCCCFLFTLLFSPLSLYMSASLYNNLVVIELHTMPVQRDLCIYFVVIIVNFFRARFPLYIHISFIDFTPINLNLIIWLYSRIKLIGALCVNYLIANRVARTAGIVRYAGARTR